MITQVSKRQHPTIIISKHDKRAGIIAILDSLFKQLLQRKISRWKIANVVSEFADAQETTDETF